MSAEITVEETAAFYRALLRSGLGIGEMNVLRKHFSAVKGGRLTELAGAATQLTLVVSDVPEGMLDVVGSGPSLPDASAVETCRALLARGDWAAMLPESVRRYFAGPEVAATIGAGNDCFRRAAWRCLLSSATMVDVAAALMRERGWHVVVDNHCDEWPYDAAADYLLGQMEGLVREHGRVCLLSTGEIAVARAGKSGRGGRNQHFALYCATRLHACGVEVAVLSAGSDGVDGESPAAGAVVDVTTLERARAMGLSSEESLAGFDSYAFFAGLGDAVVTGPTGNNVRDLRVLVGW